MTFHPVTNSIENVVEILKYSIEHILNLDYKIIITYTNNDYGSKDLIDVI